MRSLRLLVLALLLAAGLQAPARGQAQPLPGADGSIAASLARIEASLSRLADAMRQTVAQQEVSLQMRRVELSSLLLVNAERRVTELVAERDSLQEMIASSADSLAEMEANLEENPTPEAARAAEANLRMFDREAERQRERLKTLESALAEAEQSVAVLRQDIREWQSLIDRYFQRSNP